MQTLCEEFILRNRRIFVPRIGDSVDVTAASRHGQRTVGQRFDCTGFEDDSLRNREASQRIKIVFFRRGRLSEGDAAEKTVEESSEKMFHMWNL